MENADESHHVALNVLRNVTEKEFRQEIYANRQPVILRGLDIGSCVDKWTVDYLASVGGNREVKIHVSPAPQMDFINKNFLYRTLPFNELIQRAACQKQDEYFISPEEKYYLRSLGEDPRKDIADIRKQFPAISQDIKFPPFFDETQFFSSVFRISSAGTQLWTHYDIMDNMLIQVSGKKRVVLFDPKDALKLYLSGDKSTVLDIDNPDLVKYPEFSKATRYEGILQPGDILFIPALWFHNVISLDFGIAVNVFWRHLDPKFYDTKDTYGNKDLVPAFRANQVLDRALKILDEMPGDYKDFYARCMIQKIQAKAFIKDNHDNT